ncbi:Putative membrane associated protein [Borrelia coriaceae ATCC 43381]|uniref:Membrane associated protein n=2 Tax=Borrelia coriaceae TaxID=144 RepID=W5STR0_9SPIR|nr:Putative membrane associated protein [Borrelia coriaceae ATCC 43381]
MYNKFIKRRLIDQGMAMFLIMFFIAYALFSEEIYYRSVGYDLNYKIVGRYEISKEDAEEECGYRFTYDNSKLVCIDYIGKLSILIPSFFGAHKIKIEHSEGMERRSFLNGDFAFKNLEDVYIEQIEYFSNGRPKSIFNYNKSNEIIKDKHGVAYYHFIYNDDSSFCVYRFNEVGFQIKDLNNVYYTKITYNDSDRTKTVLYYDDKNYNIKAKNGIYGFRLTYDSAHNLVKEEYLDSVFSLYANPFSVAIKTYRYDLDGKLIEVLNYDIQNNLTPDENNVAIYRYEYNLKERDSFYKEYNYDANNNLTVSQDGYAMRKTILYIQNNEKRIINYSNRINKNYNSDIPASYEEKYEIMDDFKGIAVYSYKYDNKFYLIENLFFDRNFNLISDSNGVMIYKYFYNKDGLLKSQEHYGDFDNPIDDFAGVFRYEFAYDTSGNLILKSNYSNSGVLVADRSAIFEYAYEYDKQNRLISQKNFGNLGQLQDDIHGVSMYRYEYNKFGKLSKKTNYGPDLRLRDDIGGVSVYKWIYDSKGNLVDFQKFDSLGNLI